MKVSFIKFKVALFCAVMLLSISFLANRFVLAKSNVSMNFDTSFENLPPENVWTTNFYGLSKDVFFKVNQKRKLRKLKPLSWDSDLADLANKYSKKMADESFFSHYDWEGNSVVERAEDFGIKKWKKIGENLFHSEGYNKPADIAVKSWLKSKTHRKNIYDKSWTHTGIGTFKTRSGEIYITQVFLKR